MTFDNEISLRQDFTDKLDLLDKAVEKVKKVGSQTALYDALWQFTDEKLRSAPGRRVAVVISDGDDTFSRAEINDVIDIAQRTETTIFAISTKSGFLGSVPGVEAGTVKDRGDKELTRLCEETGGEVFFSGDMLELEKAFTKISQETALAVYHHLFAEKSELRRQKTQGRKSFLRIRRMPTNTRFARKPNIAPFVTI